MINVTDATSSSDKNPYLGSLTILTSLFFIWGFITCLNDILIPHLKSVFTLNYTQAMLVQFCFFTAYFVVSVPSGYLVEKIDYKGGIIAGLTIAGIGCLLFYPAAGLHSYPLISGGIFCVGIRHYLVAGRRKSVRHYFRQSGNRLQPIDHDSGV